MVIVVQRQLQLRRRRELRYGQSAPTPLPAQPQHVGGHIRAVRIPHACVRPIYQDLPANSCDHCQTPNSTGPSCRKVASNRTGSPALLPMR